MKKITLLLMLLSITFSYSQAPTINPTTPPARAVADVVSFYGGDDNSYTNVSGVDFFVYWSQPAPPWVAPDVAFDVSGNNVMKYTALGYQGIDFSATPQDVSGMENLHIDIWTNSSSPNIHLLAPGSGDFAYNFTTNPGAWTSVDIPLTYFTNGNANLDLSIFNQMKIDGGNGDDVYIDNLYFWKTPVASGTDATLSDLQVDMATVAGFSANTETYSVELPIGTTDIPQITSTTTTDINATVTTITQAPALPGDATVLVTAQDGTTTKTYTVSFSVNPNSAPTSAAPTPAARNAVDVVSIFTQAADAMTTVYSDISVSNFNPNWGSTSGNVTTNLYGGDLAMEYPNFNYQGIVIGSNIDVSAMEKLHVDIWTNSISPNVFLISATTGERSVNVASTAGAWTSVEIDLTDFTSQAGFSVADIKEFKFDGGDSNTAIYIDNLYFSKTPAGSGTDATLSDLQVDMATVAGFSANTETYSVVLPSGTVVVPQITSATTTDASATTDITQAPAIPGDATVEVTAQDGTTTKTYTVSFSMDTNAVPMANPTAPPARNAVDVVSFYGGDDNSYTNVSGVDFLAYWSQPVPPWVAPDVAFDVSGNNVMKYTALGYQGIDFSANLQDVSTMENLHIDIWTNSSSPNIHLLATGSGDFAYNFPANPGAWTSIDIPLTYFTNGNVNLDLSILGQMKVDGGNGDDVYIDNLYFYKGFPLNVEQFELADVSAYPNPTENIWNVKSLNETINSIQVFDILGKQVLSLNPNTSEVEIDASSLNTGLYFAKISAANGSKTIKLIKK